MCRLTVPCLVSLARPDGMGTVTVEEKEQFEAVRSRLMALLEHQITHFRYERKTLSLHAELQYSRELVEQ